MRYEKRVIVAPKYVRKFEGPLIFLAGPIQGAVDWQSEAILIISGMDTIANIASPRRPEQKRGEFNPAKYAKQVEWEYHHLHRAEHHGAIMFWLARESVHQCDRAYAQTTRMELGKWLERRIWMETALVVGIEEGYTGARYIRHMIGKVDKDMVVWTTLEKTCREAVRVGSNPF